MDYKPPSCAIQEEILEWFQQKIWCTFLFTLIKGQIIIIFLYVWQSNVPRFDLFLQCGSKTKQWLNFTRVTQSVLRRLEETMDSKLPGYGRISFLEWIIVEKEINESYKGRYVASDTFSLCLTGVIIKICECALGSVWYIAFCLGRMTTAIWPTVICRR